MFSWRARATLRRGARRRYLGSMHRRWRAGGAPRRYAVPGEMLLTLLWLAVPGALALVGAVVLGPAVALPSPSADVHALGGLLLVPVLGLWLLRRR